MKRLLAASMLAAPVALFACGVSLSGTVEPPVEAGTEAGVPPPIVEAGPMLDAPEHDAFVPCADCNVLQGVTGIVADDTYAYVAHAGGISRCNGLDCVEATGGPMGAVAITNDPMGGVLAVRDDTVFACASPTAGPWSCSASFANPALKALPPVHIAATPKRIAWTTVKVNGLQILDRSLPDIVQPALPGDAAGPVAHVKIDLDDGIAFDTSSTLAFLPDTSATSRAIGPVSAGWATLAGLASSGSRLGVLFASGSIVVCVTGDCSVVTVSVDTPDPATLLTTRGNDVFWGTTKNTIHFVHPDGSGAMVSAPTAGGALVGVAVTNSLAYAVTQTATSTFELRAVPLPAP